MHAKDSYKELKTKDEIAMDQLVQKMFKSSNKKVFQE
jgi:hypothetical protein